MRYRSVLIRRRFDAVPKYYISLRSNIRRTLCLPWQRTLDRAHPESLSSGSVYTYTHTYIRETATDRPRVNLFAMTGIVKRGKREVCRLPLVEGSDVDCKWKYDMKYIRILGTDARPFQLDSIGSRPCTGTRGGGWEDHQRRDALRRSYFLQRYTVRRKGMISSQGTGTVVRFAEPMMLIWRRGYYLRE